MLKVRFELPAGVDPSILDNRVQHTVFDRVVELGNKLLEEFADVTKIIVEYSDPEFLQRPNDRLLTISYCVAERQESLGSWELPQHVRPKLEQFEEAVAEVFDNNPELEWAKTVDINISRMLNTHFVEYRN